MTDVLFDQSINIVDVYQYDDLIFSLSTVVRVLELWFYVNVNILLIRRMNKKHAHYYFP